MKTKYKLIATFATIILLISIYYLSIHIKSSSLCKGNAKCFNATIAKIIDGDTFQINNEGKIRLSLVDTPEIDENGYQKAKDFFIQYVQ